MIVINARFLTQRTTGVQRFAIEICKRLPERINDEEVIFVAPMGKIIENRFLTKSNFYQFGKLTGQFWEQLELPLFLRKKGKPLLVNFVGIAPVFYRKKITFLYDLAFKHHPEWFSRSFSMAYKILVPISIRNSVSLVTDSYYVKEDIIKTYNIDSNKISVVYAAPSEKFKNLGLNREKYILTVSSLDPRKNLLKVIEAFSKLDTGYKLIIVGSKSAVFSKFDISEIKEKNIEFTGYLTDEKLVELYNKSELFIYASLFEGFGIPPLEAQACGCPCIVSNTTSLPEVYGNSVAYCDPYSTDNIADKLKKLIENKSKRDELVIKGFKNIENYSWRKSKNKLVKILEIETKKHCH